MPTTAPEARQHLVRALTADLVGPFDLDNWEARDAVKKRGEELLAGYEQWAEGYESPPPFPGTRFYMLHSLSHLLISGISLECGYAASAIRERIYCAPASDDPPMAAILILAGSSGSEGTLGGLVEQGRDLRLHLRRAYDLGVLCSNDPVCASHSPEKNYAERYLEGAACHGCFYIAECSCENRYLDRALSTAELRGQTRNIEVGVLIDDAAFARQVALQWQGRSGSER